MDILTPVLERLDQMKDPDFKVISAESQVPYSTVVKLKYRITTQPSVQTVEALYTYLFETIEGKRLQSQVEARNDLKRRQQG